MERLGDFDSEMVQDLARAVAKKHSMTASIGLANGIRIVTDKEPFKERVQVFDGHQKVFDATRWQDGDQIVSRYADSGTWKKRLSACA